MATGNKGNFFQNNKKELIGTGIGAAGGALIGGLASRASARRRADEMGLEGSERRRFIAGKTAAGAGIGTVAGGAAGFGVSKIPFKGSKKNPNIPGSHKFDGVIPDQLANSADAKLSKMSFDEYKKSNPGATEDEFKHAQFGANRRLKAQVNRMNLKRHKDANDSYKLDRDSYDLAKSADTRERARVKKMNTAIETVRGRLDEVQKDTTLTREQREAKQADLLRKLKKLQLNLSNTFDNLNTLKMATIIFDEESRSFSVIEDHMYGEVQDHLKKYKTYYAGGATAVAGGTAAGIIAKKKAKKEADRRGLTGAARKRFIAGRVAGAAAAGTVGGAALGAGASIGYDYAKAIRGADIQTKYGMSAEEWKKLSPAERKGLKHAQKWIKSDIKGALKDRAKELNKQRSEALSAATTAAEKKQIKREFELQQLDLKDKVQKAKAAYKNQRSENRQAATKGLWKKAWNPDNR